MWGSFLFVWNIQKQRKIGNITQKSEAKLPKLFLEHYLNTDQISPMTTMSETSQVRTKTRQNDLQKG